MAVPSAKVTVRSGAARPAGGDDTLCIFAPCLLKATGKPVRYTSTAVAESEHGFGPAIEHMGLHISRANKAVLLCPLPIVEPGEISRENTTGNTGTSTTTLSAPDGTLMEHRGIIRVVRGGTLGSSQVDVEFSLDGGFTFLRRRVAAAGPLELGDGVTVTFGAGTLVQGDVIHEWFGSAPKSDNDGWTSAFQQLRESQHRFRSAILIGEVGAAQAEQFLAHCEAYDVEVDRYVYGRVNAIDRNPFAQMSKTSSRMAAGTALTFATEGDTITRATGSWLAEGFRVGDHVTVAGASASAGANNGETIILDLTATVMTVVEVSANEVTSSAVVTSVPGLAFNATGNTITRSSGSWLTDGFRADDVIEVIGTASNNASFTVTAVTATVLTVTSITTGEDVGTDAASITAGQTMAEWANGVSSEFAGIDGPFRLDVSMGRYPAPSPVTGWFRRWPIAQLVSCREYQLPMHVTTWRKDDGAIAADQSQNPAYIEEYDDRLFDIANESRLTSLRSWANGPLGMFVCTSRTRGPAGTQLSMTHNVAVTNRALTIVQSVTEGFIGRIVPLDDDGKATAQVRSSLEGEVNGRLEEGVLRDVQGEGPMLSGCTWSMSEDDQLNTPEATVTGFLDIQVNGAIFRVETIATVR